MVNWQLLKFPVEGRPVMYFDGSEDLKPAQDLQPYSAFELTHWADTDMARAWFMRARDLLDDRALLERLDAPPNFSNRDANRQQADGQIEFVRRAAEAVAKGYDAINVSAMADPMNRFAWQRWVTGPAYGADYSEQITSWFDRQKNFGGGSSSSNQLGRWFVPNQTYPVFGDRPMAYPPAGIISAMARHVFLTKYPRQRFASSHPNQFVGSVGFVLEADPAQEHNRQTPVIYAKFARNKVWMDTRRSISTGRAPNVTYGTGYMPDGTKLPAVDDRGYRDFWDWRAVFFDEASATAWGDESDPRVKLGLIGPMRAYLDYLSQVVDACLSRTPTQIIEDVR